MPALIPALIPVRDPLPSTPTPSSADESTLGTFDIAIGGLGWRYASDSNGPMVWKTAPYVTQRIDQAAEPGEQTLTSWWPKSQSSFHGGAGNLNMERTDLPEQYTHIRFDQSKNVNPWLPGQLTRLPDTTTLTSETSTAMVAVTVAGSDRIAYVNQSGVLKLINPVGPVVSTFTSPVSTVFAVATDGQRIFAATTSGVWRLDPSSPTTGTKIATYPATATTAALGWVKSRLMLGVNGAVYELDSTVTTTVALDNTELRYQHPNTGWTWRCFAETPSSLIAAGDASVYSEIVEFTVSTSSGATPVLTVADTMASMPPGERILSMQNTMGTFLALGTTAGVRIGQFGTSYATPPLQYGPLTLPQTETQFPVAALAASDRFIYAAGLAVDEPGLVRVDLGTQTDQAGRFAYATDLIAPTKPASGSPATAVCALSSGLLAFSVPSVGVVLQSGTGPGTVREAWLQTSRVRWGTTEPKLYELGRIRGDFADGTVRVEGITRATTTVLGTVGNTTEEPDEFGLPSGPQEWVAYKLTLNGAGVVLNSWQMKALPGTKPGRMIQVVVSAYDTETDRAGHRNRDIGSARGRVEALFELQEAGELVYFEEFGIFGNTKTLVKIDDVQLVETARPTRTSDFGGTVTITLRKMS